MAWPPGSNALHMMCRMNPRPAMQTAGLGFRLSQGTGQDITPSLAHSAPVVLRAVTITRLGPCTQGVPICIRCPCAADVIADGSAV
jgi:hypothetical protein